MYQVTIPKGFHISDQDGQMFGLPNAFHTFHVAVQDTATIAQAILSAVTVGAPHGRTNRLEVLEDGSYSLTLRYADDAAHITKLVEQAAACPGIPSM